MNCPKCKATIEPDSFFCKHCGASIGGGAAAAQAAPAAVATAANPLTPAVTTAEINASRDPAQEKELWHGRPSWRANIGSWVLWLIASIAAVYLTWKYTDKGHAARDVVMWGILAVAVVLLIRCALVVYGEYYRLTTQRLFVHKGILSRTTDQMELVRVDDVRLRQGLMDRIMNTGDLDVLGTDKTDQAVVMESIDSPAEVAEHVRRQVRVVRTKGTLFVENV